VSVCRLVAQVPGAVECVQVRGGEAGRAADVVQPGGGFEQIGVSAENRRQAAGPGGHALDVCPAAGEAFLEEHLGELSGPGSQRVHAAQARKPRRDVHGRGMPARQLLHAALPGEALTRQLKRSVTGLSRIALVGTSRCL
jgi:hypothetical protein